MSRYIPTTTTMSTIYFRLLMVMATMMMMMMMSKTTCDAYPYVHPVKPDPFAALASALRRQQEMSPVYGYEEMSDVRQHQGMTSEDDEVADLWRLEELQRQLGRAAVMPFYGVRPQSTNWMMDDEDAGSRPLESHIVRQEPSVIEYGVPVVDEVAAAIPADQGESIWYDDLPAAAASSLSLSPSSSSAVYDAERQKQAENELLLNTLAEYMLLYDSEKAARLASGAASASESVAAGLPIGDKAIGQRRSETAMTTATTTTTTKTSMDGTSSSPSPSADAVEQTTSSPTTATSTHHKARNPTPAVPVQVADDGTLMGQKEFPMMRPAVKQQQRKEQRLTTTHGKANFATKRHFQHHTSQNEIRTPEDRLTRELDNLKAVKN